MKIIKRIKAWWKKEIASCFRDDWSEEDQEKEDAGYEVKGKHGTFDCPNCGREKEWHEAPICSKCGFDETKWVK